MGRFAINSDLMCHWNSRKNIKEDLIEDLISDFANIYVTSKEE